MDTSSNSSNPPQNDTYFDPSQDYDISAIESQIIDTARGDTLDYNSLAYSKVYRIKCLNCGYMYEGKEYIEKCPRCESSNLDDSDTVQTT